MLSTTNFFSTTKKYRVQIKLKQYFIIITIYDPLDTQTIGLKNMKQFFYGYITHTLGT